MGEAKAPPTPRLGWKIARENQIMALSARIDALEERLERWTQTHAENGKKRWMAHRTAHETLESHVFALETKIRRLGE